MELSHLIGDLIAAHMINTIYTVSGIGPTLNGRNGEGDWYYTDGEIKIAVIDPDAKPQMGAPSFLKEPALIALKNRLWSSSVRALPHPRAPGPFPLTQAKRRFSTNVRRSKALVIDLRDNIGRPI
jgi:hypothetical protein